MACFSCKKTPRSGSATVNRTTIGNPEPPVTPPVVEPPEPPPCAGDLPIVQIEPSNGSQVSFPTIILMSCSNPDVIITYTLDGTEPIISSPRYFPGLVLPNANYTVSARAFPTNGCPAGPIATATYTDVELDDFTFAYLCPMADNVGRWDDFAPNGNPRDYQFILTWTNSSTIEIVRLEVYQVSPALEWDSGQVWATRRTIYPYVNNPSQPFDCFPLVIKQEPGAVQLFNNYVDTLGSYVAGSYEWRLWGQEEIAIDNTAEAFFMLKMFLGDGSTIKRIVSAVCTPPPPPCVNPDPPTATPSCTPDVLIEGTTPDINQIFNIWRRGIVTDDCPDTLPTWVPLHTGTSDGSGDYSWTDTGVDNCCMYEYYVEVLCSPTQGFKASDTAGPVTIPCEGEVDIDADRTTTCAGDDVTLTWTSEHCDSVSIDNGIGVVGPDGSVVVNPAVTTTYTITCNNADCGNVTAMVTVTVISGSGCGCFVHTADPIAVPDSVTVTWVNTLTGLEQSAVCPNTGYKYPVGHPFAGLYAISTINYVNASNTVSVQPNLCAFAEVDCPDASWGALMTAGNPNNIVIWKGCLSSSLSPVGTYELVRSFGNVQYTIEVS